MVDPLALSLSGGIQKLGSYAGLLAFFAIVLLVLLYFAQARELKRLSQWAARQPDPARQPVPVAAPGSARPPVAPAVSPSPQSSASPSPGVPAPAVMAPRPTGAAVLATNVPGVRRVRTPVPGSGGVAVIGPTTPAGALAQAANADSGETAGTSTVTGEESVVSPPASAGESKTPEPGAPKAPAPAAASSGTQPAPAAAGEKPAAPGGAPQSPRGTIPATGGATPAAPGATPAPAGGARPPTPSATPPTPGANPPPASEDSAAGGEEPPADAKPRPAAVPLVATPVPERVAQTGIVEDAEAPATVGKPAGPSATPAPGSASGQTPRPMLPPAPHKDSPGIAVPPPAEPEQALAASHERLRRLGAHPHLPSVRAGRRRLIALIAAGVIAIVVVAVLVLPAGGSSPQPAAAGGQAAIGAAAPAKLAVAVLNGTDVGGLASKVSKQLTRDGFTAGTIANAPNQATTTTVGYTHGHQAEAIRVARALDVGESSAVPVSASNEAAARAGGRAPQVVVTIGANYTQ
jgi:hypothetical protein